MFLNELFLVDVMIYNTEIDRLLSKRHLVKGFPDELEDELMREFDEQLEKFSYLQYMYSDLSKHIDTCSFHYKSNSELNNIKKNIIKLNEDMNYIYAIFHSYDEKDQANKEFCLFFEQFLDTECTHFNEKLLLLSIRNNICEGPAYNEKIEIPELFNITKIKYATIGEEISIVLPRSDEAIITQGNYSSRLFISDSASQLPIDDFSFVDFPLSDELPCYLLRSSYVLNPEEYDHILKNDFDEIILGSNLKPEQFVCYKKISDEVENSLRLFASRKKVVYLREDMFKKINNNIYIADENINK